MNRDLKIEVLEAERRRLEALLGIVCGDGFAEELSAAAAVLGSNLSRSALVDEHERRCVVAPTAAEFLAAWDRLTSVRRRLGVR